jgi:hypothetical protein
VRCVAEQVAVTFSLDVRQAGRQAGRLDNITCALPRSSLHVRCGAQGAAVLVRCRDASHAVVGWCVRMVMTC